MEAAALPSLTTYLPEPFEIGPPDVAGPLAVFPLFGPPASFGYASFAQGRSQGVTLKELESGASVRDLVVVNPTDDPILLFEGEEVLGAQQNRTFDVSVLVPSRSTLTVPVSCVEAHRWDGSRHADEFAPAPQAAYPRLRRLKNQAAYASVVAGMAARADQSEVWSEVDDKLDELAAAAPTRAMHDGYEARRRDLDALISACSVKAGQTGMLVAIGGEFIVLDRVSQPDVLASLYQPLLQGYALDALNRAEAAAPSVDDARAVVRALCGAPIRERDGIGLGRDVRVAGPRLTGAGVTCSDELVQLSVFMTERGGPDVGSGPGRVSRPSRRAR